MRGASPVSVPRRTIPKEEEPAPVYDVCATAMTLLAALPQSALHNIASTCATFVRGAVPRAKFVSILEKELDVVVARHSTKNNNNGGTPGRTLDLRASEKEFRNALHQHVASLTREELQLLVRSVDRFDKGVVTYTSFMDFMLSSGRRAPPEDLSREDAMMRNTLPNETSSAQLVTVTVPDLTARPAAYFFQATLVGPEPGCLVVASQREIMFWDAATVRQQPIPTLVPDIGPPSSAILAMTAINHSPDKFEIATALNTGRILSFSPFSGKCTRETRVTGTPSVIAWAPASTKWARVTATTSMVSIPSDGMLLVGMTDGAISGLALGGPGLMRVAWTFRLGAGKVASLTVVPSVALALCCCDGMVFIICTLSGLVRHKPVSLASCVDSLLPSSKIPNLAVRPWSATVSTAAPDSLSSAAKLSVGSITSHGPHGVVAFTITQVPNAIFVFSRHSFTTAGVDAFPVAIVRSGAEASTAGIVWIANDPWDEKRLVTVDARGVMSHWDLPAMRAVPRQDSDLRCRLSGDIRAVVSVAGAAFVAVGKGGVLAVVRADDERFASVVPVTCENERTLDPSNDDDNDSATVTLSSNNRATRDNAAESLTIERTVAALHIPDTVVYWVGAEVAATSVTVIFPREARILDASNGGTMLKRFTFNIPSTRRSHSVASDEATVTAAITGPGGMCLVLGTNEGALLLFLMDPAAFGELIVLRLHTLSDAADLAPAIKFPPKEVTHITYDPTTTVVAWRTFDGAIFAGFLDAEQGCLRAPLVPLSYVGSASTFTSQRLWYGAAEVTCIVVTDTRDQTLKVLTCGVAGELLNLRCGADVSHISESIVFGSFAPICVEPGELRGRLRVPISTFVVVTHCIIGDEATTSAHVFIIDRPAAASGPDCQNDLGDEPPLRITPMRDKAGCSVRIDLRNYTKENKHLSVPPTCAGGGAVDPCIIGFADGTWTVLRLLDEHGGFAIAQVPGSLQRGLSSASGLCSFTQKFSGRALLNGTRCMLEGRLPESVSSHDTEPSPNRLPLLSPSSLARRRSPSPTHSDWSSPTHLAPSRSSGRSSASTRAPSHGNPSSFVLPQDNPSLSPSARRRPADVSSLFLTEALGITDSPRDCGATALGPITKPIPKRTAMSRPMVVSLRTLSSPPRDAVVAPFTRASSASVVRPPAATRVAVRTRIGSAKPVSNTRTLPSRLSLPPLKPPTRMVPK